MLLPIGTEVVVLHSHYTDILGLVGTHGIVKKNHYGEFFYLIESSEKGRKYSLHTTEIIPLNSAEDVFLYV